MSKQKRLTPEDLQELRRQEQERMAQWQREDLLRAVTQAITENPALARKFWAALIAVLPERDPLAPEYPSIREMLQAALAPDSN